MLKLTTNQGIQKKKITRIEGNQPRATVQKEKSGGMGRIRKTKKKKIPKRPWGSRQGKRDLREENRDGSNGSAEALSRLPRRVLDEA